MDSHLPCESLTLRKESERGLCINRNFNGISITYPSLFLSGDSTRRRARSHALARALALVPPASLPSSVVALSHTTRANGCRFPHGTDPAPSDCNMATEVRNPALSPPSRSVFSEQNPKKWLCTSVCYYSYFLIRNAGWEMQSCKLDVLHVVPLGLSWFGCLNSIKPTDWTRIIVDLKSSHVTFSSRKKIFFIQELQFTFITVNELCNCRQMSSDSFSFSLLHTYFFIVY